MMHLVKLSIALLALVGLMCTAKIIVETNEPGAFAELEKAAINILTNCYANQDKSIVLVGSFPQSFIDELTSRQFFSLVLLDHRTRPMRNNEYYMGQHRYSKSKVNIVVMLASGYEEIFDIHPALLDSRYYNTMAFFLLIGWSPLKRNAGCDGKIDTFDLLSFLNRTEILNANLLCDHRKDGIVLYSSNPFTNQAPKPWTFAGDIEVQDSPIFTYFVRKYRENADMCENLDYERTRNLAGLKIKILRACRKPYCTPETYKNRVKSRRLQLQLIKRTFYIDDFIAYVNGTGVDVLSERVGGRTTLDLRLFQSRPLMLRLAGKRTFVYPHGTECMYLVTQFRGNKSQLQKIGSVIDGYSWIGVAIVCFVTLLFFKYVFRQSLMNGLLNVVRLSCNFGLPTIPSNAPPRIYMTTVLFFVVTMQGIFVSNLAALLTQDTPVRQVDSIQDLADLGYTVYTPRSFFILFKDVLPESRVISWDRTVKNCLYNVLRDPSNACLKSGESTKEIALQYNLHLTGCVRMEYVTNSIPIHWALEEKINKFSGTVIAGGIMMPLNYSVDEKRLRELESQEVEPEPRIMTFPDLAFAFVILGIGLTSALVSFVIEIAYHRYRRRVRTTRVISLN